MKEFFKVEKITIEQGDIEHIFFMSPLKVRHLGDIQRISAISGPAMDALNGKAEINDAALHELIIVLEQVITPAIGELPAEVLRKLFKFFMDLNFNDENFTGKKQKEETFTTVLDFLISQGHTMTDILEYTLPQLRLFVGAASSRIMGDKDSRGDTPAEVIDAHDDPLAVFRKIGIPITNN